jgi:peptidoglycan/LPS O-acetylase OafA/YrhL
LEVEVDQDPGEQTVPLTRVVGPTKAQASSFVGIEILRGVAASAVVVEHTWALTTSPKFWGSQIVEGLGEWGVVLFFLISGFLLCENFWRPRDEWSVRSFWTRRFFRIAPAYYLNVAILFLFFAPTNELFSDQGLKQVAANATFTHWLFPGTSSSLNVNGALWTLTIEMCLYLVLPLMAPPMWRHPFVTFSCLFGLGMAYRVWITFWASGIQHQYFEHGGPPEGIMRLFLIRQFMGVLPLFAIGMLARWLFERVKRERGIPWAGDFSLLVLLVLLIPSLLLLELVERGTNYVHPFFFILYEPVLVLAMLPCILYGARPEPVGGLRFGSRIGSWLGERSYSLYLWHFPIILAVFGRGAEIEPARMTGAWGRVVLVAFLSVAAAAVSYSAIERPARLYGRRLSIGRGSGNISGS